MTPNISTAPHEATFQLTKREAPLSANTHGAHWAAVAREHRDLRWDAKILTIATGLRGKVEAVHLRLLVYPPDHRRRDEDNLIPHLLKPVKDGVAEALGLDDTREFVSYECYFAGVSFDRRWRYVVEILPRERGKGDAEAAHDPGRDRPARVR